LYFSAAPKTTLLCLATLLFLAIITTMGEKIIKPLRDDPTATEVDRKYIHRTYEIAKSAMANGNHPFGALLVCGGEIIAEFENAVVTSRDVTKHAETGLVSLSSQKFDREILSQSTLYTSTEPCVMCCGAIHWLSIARMAYGTSSTQLVKILGGNDEGISSKEIFARINPKLEITGPIMEAEGIEIHQSFWPEFLRNATRQ
jgi:tRNA(Arg) A34 adenosine deaminase TadA